VLLVSIPCIGAAQSDEPQLSPVLERHLEAASIQLSRGERRRLLDNAPVSRLLEADGTKEVAVFGAVWINAPIRRYVQALQQIETFEKGGGFRLTRRISSPPRLEDFADLRLSREDVADLRTCRVGRCEVKLGEQAVERFQRDVNWAQPDHHEAATALMRRVLQEYVAGYMEGGNSRLAVYRDASHPTSVGDEVEHLVNGMPALARTMPDVRNYLLRYPHVSLPGASSLFYWQETQFGLKPTIRLSHLVIHERPGEAVVASKMIYATHYFWTTLELRVLLADPSRGEGFWFITTTRSRLDGLTGFTGFFIRRKVRAGVLEGTHAVLQATRRKIENRQDVRLQ
jgi:hypothetical protein